MTSRQLHDHLTELKNLRREFNEFKSTALERISRLTAAGVAVGENLSSAVVITNTSPTDLDAVSPTPGTAVIVELFMPHTGLAQITLTSRMALDSTTPVGVVSYKVSGATTKAATDNESLAWRSFAANVQVQASFVSYPVLNAGLNVIEMQARTTSGTLSIQRTWLGAKPW